MQSTTEELVFLPGASGNMRFWQPLAARLPLAAPRRFHGWPGFGGLPRDESVQGILDLAARVSAQIASPVNLFAQSMGGVVAMLVALGKPGLVKRMVLSATSGGIDLSRVGASDWRREFRAQNPDYPTWFEAESWDLSSRLGEIQMPILLLWGDADPISPVAVGERLAELLPNAELVVVRGGTHDLVSERVGEVLPHVARHLTRG